MDAAQQGPETPREAGSAELSVLRSSHRPLPLWRQLFPVYFVFAALAMLGFSLASALGSAAFAAIAPFALGIGGFLAWPPLRSRHVQVDCHAAGLVISNTRQRSVVLFDDVDQLWLVLDRAKWVAVIRAVRLVEHSGASHTIPTNLTDAVPLLQWIVRECSDAFLAEAQRSLYAGETLRFGDIELDKQAIRGRRWELHWLDIRLVRHTAGRVSFFRGQTIFPTRSIPLDGVPHPFILTALIAKCAAKIEIDSPFSF